ncbi:MAG: hypothetical protein R3A78_07085 [Polyangiales bacterium]|nr:hypothetical protein [Myxococcales bacterium]
MSDDAERIERWEKRITFLEGECAILERNWARIPKHFWLALAAPVVGIAWNALAGALTLLTVLSYIGTLTWLTGVRRKEAAWELETAREQVATLRRRSELP